MGFSEKAVVFDMDGVIFDTERIYATAWLQAAEDVGGIPEIDMDFHYCMGRNRADIRTYFLSKYGTDFPFEELMRARACHVDRFIEEHGLPFKTGVPEIFDWLHQNGFAVALATSTNEIRTERYMKLSGISHFFDHIITGNLVAHSKPDPDIYLTACRLLEIAPNHCYAVEDSPNGLRSAHNAGLKTVMIPDLIPFGEELRPYVSVLCRDMEELKIVLAHSLSSFS